MKAKDDEVQSDPLVSMTISLPLSALRALEGKARGLGISRSAGGREAIYAWVAEGEEVTP